MNDEELNQRALAGDLSAHDALGGLHYDRRDFAKAAEHYLKAFVGGYYEGEERRYHEGPGRLRSMRNQGEIPSNSDAYRLLGHLVIEAKKRDAQGIKAASIVGWIGFFGTMLLIYLGTTEGSFLRSISLIASGAVSYAAYMMTANALEK